MTVDEARAFLSATENDRLTALYVLAIAVGLREGELLALRWDDIGPRPTGWMARWRTRSRARGGQRGGQTSNQIDPRTIVRGSFRA
jgi:integrase